MERVFLVRSGDRTGLPVPISRFLPAAPSSPHLSQELLPEAVAGAARMHSSDRRPPLLPAEAPPCLSQSGGLSPAEACQDIMLLAISFPGARIPP